MKKYTWSVKILLPLLGVLLVAATYAGVPAIRGWWKERMINTAQESIPDPVIKTPYTVEEAQILQELIAICGHMDSLHQFSVEGNIQASDPADSVNVLDTHFRYCRNGKAFYYRAGDNETIVLADASIAVNSSVKKIFLGPPKAILPALHMPADSILNIWKEDRYTITRSAAPPLVTINLVCENHVTCKQYRFIYNENTRLLNEVYLRLTDLNDPLNKEMDKPVKITYHHWEEGKVPGALFKKDHYVTVQGGSYVPSSLYRDYELLSTY